MTMVKRAAQGLLLFGLLIAVAGSIFPVSGTPQGSSTELSCGPALVAAVGRSDGGRIMTGADTAITKSAWCEGAAGDVLRPTLAVAGALLLLGVVLRISAGFDGGE